MATNTRPTAATMGVPTSPAGSRGCRRRRKVKQMIAAAAKAEVNKAKIEGRSHHTTTTTGNSSLGGEGSSSCCTTTQEDDLNKMMKAAPFVVTYNNENAINTATTTMTTAAAAAAASTPLDTTLRNLGLCPSHADDVGRRRAINHLERVVVRWSMALKKQQKQRQQQAAAAATTSSSKKQAAATTTTTTTGSAWVSPRACLITCGSYRLRVSREDSDLDCVALSPPHCSRDDFFTSLVAALEADTTRIKEVHPIPTAYTPVIKFVLDGFKVDLLFARASNPAKLLAHQQHRVSPSISETAETTDLHDLYSCCSSSVMSSTGNSNKPGGSQQQQQQQHTQRVEYMIDDSDLVNQDEAGVRSLNAARVSQILLGSVPDLDVYRVVLRAVKEFATINGIYSNVLGFLGGVNWAILVAYVAKQHPDATPNELLTRFFQVFCTWKWPNPVMLTADGRLETTPPRGDVVPMPSWDPSTNPRDGLHIMPIITPAYPSMNSSYNVGIPQLRRIQDEMIRACNTLTNQQQQCDSAKTVGAANDEAASTTGVHHQLDMAALFRPSTFFTQHQHFLQVTIRANPGQDFVEWFRLCESRLRLLIVSLETQEVHAWPFGRFFERFVAAGTEGNSNQEEDGADGQEDHQDDSQRQQESRLFIGLRFAPGVDSTDLRHLTSDFLYKINSWDGRKHGMDLALAHVTQQDLPKYVLEQVNSTAATVNQHDDCSISHRSEYTQSVGSSGVSCSAASSTVETNSIDDDLYSVASSTMSTDAVSPTFRPLVHVENVPPAATSHGGTTASRGGSGTRSPPPTMNSSTSPSQPQQPRGYAAAAAAGARPSTSPSQPQQPRGYAAAAAAGARVATGSSNSVGKVEAASSSPTKRVRTASPPLTADE